MHAMKTSEVMNSTCNGSWEIELMKMNNFINTNNLYLVYCVNMVNYAYISKLFMNISKLLMYH